MTLCSGDNNVFKVCIYRVSARPGKPGNPGNVLESFSVLEFVLEFTIFRILSWKCPRIFLYSSAIFSHSHYFCILPLAILSRIF